MVTKYAKNYHITYLLICLFGIISSFYTFEFYISYLTNKNLNDLNVQKKVELLKEYEKEYD